MAKVTIKSDGKVRTIIAIFEMRTQENYESKIQKRLILQKSALESVIKVKKYHHIDIHVDTIKV